MGGFAWVTLATNDSYSLGALVLANSLKQAGTVHQLAVLVTPGVTNAMREKLASVFNVVQEVNILDSKDEANLKLLKRPELGVTFTKLHCWRLTQYEKCVFLDADTLVLQNCDELFEREELSAAPDVGWPDCFNSGVFVYRPSLETYDKLIAFALEKGSFDGGDQGLLNLYFSDWAYKDISKHLPFIYNMCSTACYSYLPAFKQFGANAKIIHFIGATKPWLQYFNTETRRVQPSGDASHLESVLQRWWDIFCSLIHPQLSPAMAGLAGAFAQLTLGVPRTQEQEIFESLLRKQAWEVGNIDYLGKDSFDNIWSKITETLNAGSPPAPAPIPAPAPAESQSQSTAQPQEEAKSDEPPISVDKPTDISTPVDTLNLPTTEPTPSVEAPKSVDETPVTPIVSPKELEPVQQDTGEKEKGSPEVTSRNVETSIPSAEEQTAEESAIPTPTSVSAEVPKEAEIIPVLKEVPQSVPASSEKVIPPVISKEVPVPVEDPKPVEVSKPPTEKAKPVIEPSKTPIEPAKPPAPSPKAPVEPSPPTPPVEEPKAKPKSVKAVVEAPTVVEAPKPPAEAPKLTEAPPPAENIPSTKLPDPKPKETKETKVVEQVKEVSKVVKEPPKPSTKAKTVEPATTTVPKPSTTSEAAASSEASSTPTPPPRKTDKPKKVAAKAKK